MKLLHKIEIDPIQLVYNLIEFYSFPFLLEVLINYAKDYEENYRQYKAVTFCNQVDPKTYQQQWMRVANDLRGLNVGYKKMKGVSWNYNPKTKELINDD